MRPSTSSTPSPTRLQLWKSPLPYLFGGLAIMFVLIFVALVILVCSYRKQASGSSSGEAEENQSMHMNTVMDTEPKIVVIMAGDDKPTYLATPVTSSTCSTELV
jgi:heme/copper-type cytochrome/quinol oxidase subunit 2